MKLSKDELKSKINDLIKDNDISIQLLEDIEDSMDIPDTSAYDELKTKYDELESKNKELESKYKERFLSGTKVIEEPKEPQEPIEKDIIDIKEI